MGRGELRTFDQRFWKIFIPFLLFIGLILFFPYWFTQFQIFGFHFKDTGQIGDTIGGILGPFIAIGAAILTFFAFWVQLKANEQQRRDIAIERFETKFYELLRLHKENINEIEIQGRYRGRKAFQQMFYELRCLYAIVESEWPEGSAEEKSKIAYTFYFFGSNAQIVSGTKFSEAPSSVIVELSNKLTLFKNEYRSHYKSLPNNRSISESPFLTASSKVLNVTGFSFDYYPFNGYASELGHVYRHLYQTIKFVVESPVLGRRRDTKNCLTKEERLAKYEYIKTIRAQLSNHEQAMIYFNSFFDKGLLWWSDKTASVLNEDGFPISYFLDFGIIKNVPLFLIKFGKRPEDKFREKLLERYPPNIVEQKLNKLLEGLEDR